jgi:hypothetical protein
VSVDALRSPLDELRDIYKAEQPRKPLELGIPASHGQLVVRYGAPTDRSQLSAVFRAVQSGAVLDDYADVDLVVDCVQGRRVPALDRRAFPEPRRLAAGLRRRRPGEGREKLCGPLRGLIKDAATVQMAGGDGFAYVCADPVDRAVMREITRVIQQRHNPPDLAE